MGNDVLAGGAGNDSLDGCDDVDTADFGSATASLTVDLAAGTATGGALVGTDTLVGIENVIGGMNDDTLIGDAGQNLLQGDGGADSLTGAAENDTLEGGMGDDVACWWCGQ